MTRSLTVVGNDGVAMQRRAHAFGSEQLLEHASRLVVADDADQGHLRAERRGVARDIGRTARPLLAARDLDHRHRRFRRDALNVAEPVAIEHHVADDQRARTRNGVAKVGEPLRGAQSRPADPEIFNASGAHQRRIEQIAAVEKQGLSQAAA